MNIKLNETDDFDFSVDNRNLETVRGVNELAQVVSIILKTYVGESKFDKRFGTRIQDIVGDTPTDNEIRQTIKNGVLSDSRFVGVDRFQIIRNQDHTISINFNVKVADGNIINIGGNLVW